MQKTALFLSLGCSIFATVLSLATRRLPQPKKLGYVRSETLLQEASLTAACREKLAVKRREIEQNVQTMTEELTRRIEGFRSRKSGLSEKEQAEEIEKIGEREWSLTRYREASLKKLADQESEELGSAFEVLNERIARFAKERGYQLIWGTLSEGNLLYGEAPLDLTEPLIEYVNQWP